MFANNCLDRTMNGNSSPDQIVEETASLLQRKGMIEVVVEIGHEGPQRHTDLREELLLSSSTVQQRLKEGKQREILSQSLRERSSGTTDKVYELAELGKSVYEEAQHLDLYKYYKSKRGILRTIEKHEREVITTLSPKGAEWLTEIDMEEHEISDIQTIFDQFK